MKKKKIFYVFGFGDTPESIYVQYLRDNLDADKYEIICDYYAQYNPKAALIDINNYIVQNNIDIVIGDNLGAYLVSLINNDKILRFCINPLQNPPGYELEEYEISQKDDKGKEYIVKMVPKHIVEYYKNDELKQNFNNKLHIVFDNTDNLEYYKDLLKDKNIQIINPESSYKYVVDLLNSL